MRLFLLVLNTVATLAGLVALALGAWLPAVAIMLPAHLLFLYATLYPKCDWWGPILKTCPGDRNEVWLTIDDGPDPVDTPFLLDLLRAHQARATFFLIGEKAREHPELVRRIVQEGHGVGNHTLTHPAYAFWRYLPGQVWREIAGCQEELGKIIGQAPDLFRAPAGMRNCFVHPVLGKLGLRLIGWSARGYDGSKTDPLEILARIERRLKPGAIVLMHEGRSDAQGGHLVKSVAPALLELIQSKGLRVAPPRLQNL